MQSKERNTEYKREWRKKNPKRSREISKANNKRRKRKGLKPKPLTEEQKERGRLTSRIWKKNNPDKVQSHWLKRKEKECKKYLFKTRYERKNPNRAKVYYNKKKLAVAKSLASGDQGWLKKYRILKEVPL